MENPEEDPIIKMIRSITEDQHSKFAAFSEAKAEMKKESDKVEREVLMELWAKAGNAPHTYYIAVKTIHQFVEALHGMRSIEGIPIDMHIIICEALAKCAEVDAKTLKAIQIAKEKYNVE